MLSTLFLAGLPLFIVRAIYGRGWMFFITYKTSSTEPIIHGYGEGNNYRFFDDLSFDCCEPRHDLHNA